MRAVPQLVLHLVSNLECACVTLSANNGHNVQPRLRLLSHVLEEFPKMDNVES